MKRETISAQTRVVLIGMTAAMAIGIGVTITGAVFAQQKDPAPDSPEFYSQKVEPILDDNCYSCHEEGQSGCLRLDSYQAILNGGGRGPAIVPGDPETSLLIKAIRRTGPLKMPPKHTLEPAEVDVLTAWVKAGAKG